MGLGNLYGICNKSIIDAHGPRRSRSVSSRRRQSPRLDTSGGYGQEGDMVGRRAGLGWCKEESQEVGTSLGSTPPADPRHECWQKAQTRGGVSFLPLRAAWWLVPSRRLPTDEGVLPPWYRVRRISAGWRSRSRCWRRTWPATVRTPLSHLPHTAPTHGKL